MAGMASGSASPAQGGSAGSGGTPSRGGSAGHGGNSNVDDCSEYVDVCLDPADASSGRCCSEAAGLMAYVRPTNIESVIFRKAADNRIYELTRDGSALWSAWNLADIVGPFTALSNPQGYIRALGIPAVVFRGDQGQLYEIGGIPTAPYWKHAALTETGGPVAVGDPIAFVRLDPTGRKIDVVAYRDDRGHLLELSRVPGSSWTLVELVDDAASDPHAYVTADDTQAVVFRGTDDHIHQLEWSTGVLARHDLTKAAQSPLGIGEPRGFAHVGEHSGVVYRDASGHVQQLYRARGSTGWIHVDLTLSLAPAASDPFPYFRTDTADAIVYLSTDRHIHELSFRDGVWYWTDLTTITGCEKATGMPFGYIRSDGMNAVIFWSVDERKIIEITGSEAGGWASRNLLGAIPNWP